MLVLTRKIDEQIKIGDDITITVIKLRNNQIRIGIEAPRDIRVLRGELEPKAASQGDAHDQNALAETAPATATAVKSEVSAKRVAVEQSAPPEQSAPSEQSGTPQSQETSSTQNRVTRFINATDSSPTSTSHDPASEIQNDVIDGLMSADEMIAKGRSLESDCPSISQEKTPPALQIFSGRIRTQSSRTTSMRAPLSDFFNAT